MNRFDKTAVALLAVLALAADASAGPRAVVRGGSRPYRTNNGRAVSAPKSAPAPAQTRGAAPTAEEMRRDVAMALNGGNSRSIGSRTRFGAAGRGLRRADGDSEKPAYLTSEGARIRTAYPFDYSQAEPSRKHTVDGGGAFVSIDHAKAHDVGRAPGVRQGPKDTLPPCNPGSPGCSGSSGGNSITANTGATTISVGNSNSGAHDNTNGNSGNNGNPFGGGTGFDPSF